ncbi:DUF1573 domain-containing protein [Saccharicrinis sp. FJH62]|uniref:DUF1573 domain-containing protein n=1 Tax=Saccharicrinis sp. FJH62 TaxID=3344657 RepID=UPI0035D46337
MKKFGRTSILLTLIVFTSSLVAQTLSPKIAFSETDHDLGNIKEDGGKVETVFEFRNLGQEPLMIKNVTSSCGCTTPTYSKEPILPGKSGQIRAVFDPMNRPGKVLKHVTVYTNASAEPVVLTLTGNVEKKEPTILDKYPYSFGDVRLNKSHVSFLKMNKNEVKESTVDVINTNQSKPVKIEFVRVPEFITVTTEPQILQPNQKGLIHIKYDASKVSDWGFVLSGMFMKQNGQVDYNHKLSVSVTIEDDFTKMTPQERAQAPDIVFENTTFNFGTIKQGQKVEYEFPFSNTGKSNLIIRKVKASCGCTAIKPEKTVIGAGENSSIKIEFDSRGKSGRQYKTVTVITNAPNHPTVVLKIIGTVN